MVEAVLAGEGPSCTYRSIYCHFHICAYIIVTCLANLGATLLRFIPVKIVRNLILLHSPVIYRQVIMRGGLISGSTVFPVSDTGTVFPWSVWHCASMFESARIKKGDVNQMASWHRGARTHTRTHAGSEAQRGHPHGVRLCVFTYSQLCEFAAGLSEWGLG